MPCAGRRRFHAAAALVLANGVGAADGRDEPIDNLARGRQAAGLGGRDRRLARQHRAEDERDQDA